MFNTIGVGEQKTRMYMELTASMASIAEGGQKGGTKADDQNPPSGRFATPHSTPPMQKMQVNRNDRMNLELLN